MQNVQLIVNVVRTFVTDLIDGAPKSFFSKKEKNYFNKVGNSFILEIRTIYE
jgi:hypothetical protein